MLNKVDTTIHEDLIDDSVGEEGESSLEEANSSSNQYDEEIIAD
jgi:hypothetical protein